ncbi:hypothetical protein MBRA1_003796 [Malassezia brasiliensis]|uniref:Cyclin N-terminal domain-containing protein n=1 Tax=Malassezia brasiliensis TaxID=1821822 RepID=A0AAF0DVJ6_9BASI|nr:hypothetical protein MBRA1_003796 [Malassezia brasiliensis]
MMMSAGGGAYFDAGFANNDPHAQQGMQFPLQSEAWPGMPMGMVMCAPPAPRLNAARPRHDPHHPWAHAWYPAYMPMPQHQPHGVYADWQQPAPTYGYGAAPPPPGWGASWAAHPQAHAQAYAAQAHAQAYAAQAHAQAYAPPAPYAPAPHYGTGAAYAPFYDEQVAPAPAPVDRTPTPPPEATAVPLAGFCAEAIWRASAALIGLGPAGRVDEHGNTTSTPQGTPSASVSRSASPSHSSEHSDAASTNSGASVSGSYTPSTPPSTCSSPASDKQALDSSMEALRLAEDASPARLDGGPRSTALHRLVHEMRQNPRAFPSLSMSPTRTERPRSASGRSRTPNKHTTLTGEVSPAFRRFVHQVLAQTLLTPTAVVLALYYVQLFPAAIDADAETALGLLSQPTSTTPFKLLTLGLMMANKFLDDNTFLNKTWHEVTGIPLAELNKMESYFLCRTQFHLSLSDAAWRQHLMRLREAEQGTSERSDRTHVLETLDALLAEAP